MYNILELANYIVLHIGVYKYTYTYEKVTLLGTFIPIVVVDCFIRIIYVRFCNVKYNNIILIKPCC